MAIRIKDAVTMSLIYSTIVVSLLAVTGLGGQQPLDTVPKYSLKEFNEQVPTKHHFVFFFVPWNGESKSVAPVWEELGEKYNNRGGNDLVLAKVDCTQDVELCAEQNVTDYPTLKFYKFGGPNPDGVKFRGVRDFHSLEQFLNSFVNPGADPVFGSRMAPPAPVIAGLHILLDENFDAAVESGNAFINFCAPWSSRCIDLQKTWPDLAEHFQYDDDVTFGQLDCTMYKSKCNEHKVRGYPTLLWFVDGEMEEKYSKKELDFNTLKAYVYKKLKKTEVKKKTPAMDENVMKSAALVMDVENFYDVLESEPLVFANFHTPWCTPCQKLDPIWEELASHYKYNKNIKIATVDCTRNKALCEENDIQEFPTLNVYYKSELKGPYGGELTAQELVIFTENLLKDPKDEL